MDSNQEQKKIFEIIKDPRKLLLIGVLLFLILGGLTIKATDYIEKPEFCQKCHSMKPYYNLWMESTHKGVTCFACHIGFTPIKKVESIPVTNKRYWALTFGEQTINISKYMNRLKEVVAVINRKIEQVTRQVNFVTAKLQVIKKFFSIINGGSGSDLIAPMWKNCLNCHKDLVSPSSKTDNIGHYNHLKTGLTCIQCHRNVVHGRGVTMTRSECLNCHKESFPKPSSHKPGKFSFTHGKSYLTRKSCSLCHVNGSKEKLCMDCHGVIMPHPPDYPKIHVQSIKSAGIKKCINCHQDKDSISVIKNNSEPCSVCHGKNMPHKGYYKIINTHGSLAVNNGTRSCYACHNQTDCNNCHGGIPMPHPKNFLPKHMPLAKNLGQENCLNCHRAGAGRAKECISCHVVEVPHPQDWAYNHVVADKKSCDLCHSPKNPVNPTALWATKSYCDKCHEVGRTDHHYLPADRCNTCHFEGFCSRCH